MTSTALATAAAALVTWPTAMTAGTRLANLTPKIPRPRKRPRRLLAAVLVLLVPFLGPAVSIAAVLVGLAYWTHRRTSTRTKAKVAAVQAMAEALRTTIAELRTGAPPTFAAECAAEDAPPETAQVMQTLATSARFGGEFAAPHGVAKAWSLSRRHGLPLVDLLDAVRRDLAAGARFITRAEATMAGPRASALVLAGLPGLGVLLGEGIGAAPLHVLTGTVAGQVLLVAGAALILAGVAWSTRLTSAVLL